MNIAMTVVKDGNDCQFFADVILDADSGSIGCLAAKPATFIQHKLFATDERLGLLTLPLDDAKKMAKEILAL